MRDLELSVLYCRHVELFLWAWSAFMLFLIVRQARTMRRLARRKRELEAEIARAESAGTDQ